MCKPLDFEDSQHKILMNRIISGDIILFLGSGFSLGAVSCLEGEDNRKVPFPSQEQKRDGRLCAQHYIQPRGDSGKLYSAD